VDGRIVTVTNGRQSVVARWPSPKAAYQPPMAARHGFVGLGYGRRGIVIWYVTRRDARRLAGPVAQSFGVSAGGTRISFSRSDLRKPSGPSRLTLLGGQHFNHTVATKRLSDVRARGGPFVGRRVLLELGDAQPIVAVWDPRTGQVTRLPRWSDAGPTDPVAHQVVLSFGDSGCWSAGAWHRSHPLLAFSGDCSVRWKTYSPSGAQLAGIDGVIDNGLVGAHSNRLVVLDARGGGVAFRSRQLPGAFQAEWEDRSHILVLARQGQDVVVYRCSVDSRDCRRVWTVDGSGDRYATWLVPYPP
jgi:hypothetical protein